MPPHSVIFSALHPQVPLSPFRIQRLHRQCASPTRTFSREMLKREPDARPFQPGGTLVRAPPTRASSSESEQPCLAITLLSGRELVTYTDANMG
jgi:hypothetical protein